MVIFSYIELTDFYYKKDKMIRVKDHQTERLFDPEIPAYKIFKCFHESFGRPTKELYTALGVTIILLFIKVQLSLKF